MFSFLLFSVLSVEFHTFPRFSHRRQHIQRFLVFESIAQPMVSHRPDSCVTRCMPQKGCWIYPAAENGLQEHSVNNSYSNTVGLNSGEWLVARLLASIGI
jgi:hypothetical protein